MQGKHGKDLSMDDYEKIYPETTTYIKSNIFHGYDSMFYVLNKNCDGHILPLEYNYSNFNSTFYKYFPENIRKWFDKYYIKHVLTIDNTKDRCYKLDDTNYLNLFAGFRFIDLLKESGLTLILDGSTDVSGNSIYTFIAAKLRTYYYLALEDYSQYVHSASFLMGKIKDVLNKFNLKWEQFVAVTTDNPTVMKSLREKVVVSSNDTIDSFGCALHLFSLITGSILEIQPFFHFFSACKNLVHFVHKSPRWNHAIKHDGISHELDSFVETRWYSSNIKANR
jgi:hypothetical protein